MKTLTTKQSRLLSEQEEIYNAFLAIVEGKRAPAYKAIEEELARLLYDFFARYGTAGRIEYVEIVKYGRIGKLSKEIKSTVRKLASGDVALLRSELPEVYKASALSVSDIYDWKADEEQAEEDGESELTTPWSGSTFDVRTRTRHSEFYSLTDREVMRSAFAGVPIKELETATRKRLKRSMSALLVLAATEAMYFANRAEIDVYKSNDIAKVIYRTVGDARVCEICAPYEGDVFSIDDIVFLPQHTNCRCTYFAVTDRDGELIL